MMVNPSFEHYVGVLEKLQCLRFRGTYAVAKCPAHEDRVPSLTLRIAKDTGNLLLKCFAGCRTATICKALGITESQLFAPREQQAPRAIQAVYDYKDAQGNVVFQVVRYVPKAFRQRRPDGQGGWLWNLEGVQRVLYNMPQLVDPMMHHEPVWIVEGEKCADALATLGLVATTASGGAGRWQKIYNETLRGRNVIIVPDNDAAGLDHADLVARQLLHVAASVKVVELPGLREKEDVVQWIEASDNVVAARDGLIHLASYAHEYGGEGHVMLLASRVTMAEVRLRVLIGELTMALGKRNGQ